MLRFFTTIYLLVFYAVWAFLFLCLITCDVVAKCWQLCVCMCECIITITHHHSSSIIHHHRGCLSLFFLPHVISIIIFDNNSCDCSISPMSLIVVLKRFAWHYGSLTKPSATAAKPCWLRHHWSTSLQGSKYKPLGFASLLLCTVLCSFFQKVMPDALSLSLSCHFGSS